MTLKIRQIEPHDFATLAQLENENWPLTSTPVIMRSTAQSILTRILEKRVTYLLAVQNEEIVGALDYHPRHNLPTADHVLTFGVMVVQKARGQGIAKKLIHYFLNLERQDDFQKVSIEVLSSNPAAIHLYESLGFIQERRQRAEFIINNKPVDNLFYAYFFTENPQENYQLSSKTSQNKLSEEV